MTTSKYGAVFREVRACSWCGYKRKVKVTPVLSNGVISTEMFAKLCTSCDALSAANIHEQKAKKLRQKAATILDKRKSTCGLT